MPETNANKMLSPSLACNTAPVKRVAKKLQLFLVQVFAVTSTALLMSATAHAQDAQTRAMMNSMAIINLLEGVVPEGLPNLLEQIRSGQVQRVAPKYPVWILETERHSILYYQGQPAFTGQNATRLVDDNGFRFGQRALEQALRTRNTWLTLVLSGATYKAYCAARPPYVACSLIAG